MELQSPEGKGNRSAAEEIGKNLSAISLAQTQFSVDTRLGRPHPTIVHLKD